MGMKKVKGGKAAAGGQGGNPWVTGAGTPTKAAAQGARKAPGSRRGK